MQNYRDLGRIRPGLILVLATVLVAGTFVIQSAEDGSSITEAISVENSTIPPDQDECPPDSVTSTTDSSITTTPPTPITPDPVTTVAEVDIPPTEPPTTMPSDAVGTSTIVNPTSTTPLPSEPSTTSFALDEVDQDDERSNRVEGGVACPDREECPPDLVTTTTTTTVTTTTGLDPDSTTTSTVTSTSMAPPSTTTTTVQLGIDDGPGDLDDDPVCVDDEPSDPVETSTTMTEPEASTTTGVVSPATPECEPTSATLDQQPSGLTVTQRYRVPLEAGPGYGSLDHRAWPVGDDRLLQNFEHFAVHDSADGNSTGPVLLATGWPEETDTFLGFTFGIDYVSYDPDSQILVALSGAHTGEAKLNGWSVVTGELAWSAPVPEVHTFRVERGGVLWGYLDTGVIGIEMATGEVLFDFETEGTPSMLTATDTVMVTGVGGPGGGIFAYDQVTGDQLWRSSLNTFEAISPLGTDLLVNTTHDYREFFAVDARTGAEIWSVPFDCVVQGFQVNENLVFVEARDGIHALDLRTGEERWAFRSQDLSFWRTNRDTPRVGVAYVGEVLAYVEFLEEYITHADRVEVLHQSRVIFLDAGTGAWLADYELGGQLVEGMYLEDDQLDIVLGGLGRGGPYELVTLDLQR